MADPVMWYKVKVNIFSTCAVIMTTFSTMYLLEITVC